MHDQYVQRARHFTTEVQLCNCNIISNDLKQIYDPILVHFLDTYGLVYIMT